MGEEIVHIYLDDGGELYFEEALEDIVGYRGGEFYIYLG